MLTLDQTGKYCVVSYSKITFLDEMKFISAETFLEWGAHDPVRSTC